MRAARSCPGMIPNWPPSCRTSCAPKGSELSRKHLAEHGGGTAGDSSVTTRDGRVFQGSHLLLAVGREANTRDLNLSAVGIDTTRTGIKTDAALRMTINRCRVRHRRCRRRQTVYAPCGCDHVVPVVWPARQGHNRPYSAGATYTDPEPAPEPAHVGLTEGTRAGYMATSRMWRDSGSSTTTGPSSTAKPVVLSR